MKLQAMLKNYIIKNWDILCKSQIILFTVFIILALVYYWDRPAHIYFNRNIETVNFQRLFSLIMTYIFILFSVLVLIYPFLLILQIYFLRMTKGSRRKLMTLSLLYLMSVISVFALFAINGSHTIKGMN